MATRAESGTGPQVRLSRERVLRAAVAVADERGIEALTMRGLAGSLGVEAMSLYHHVANKDAVLDGLVDVVMGEIEGAVAGVEAPEPEDDWRAAVRGRVLAARTVMLRHRWAPALIGARAESSGAVVGYFNGLVGLMRRGGLSYDLIHHAMHVLESRSLGFTQELFEADSSEPDPEELARMAEHMPYLAAMLAEVAHNDPESTLGWCDDQVEFEFSLDLILEGLERLRGRG